MATYMCSDIHGSFDYFLAMLKKINFSKSDTLYIIGDILDKGPEPIRLADYCMNSENIKLLMGNHELMFIKAYTENDKENIWFSNGGLYTCRQFEALPGTQQDDIFEYIQELPIIIRHLNVENKEYYLSHATYYPKSLSSFGDVIKMAQLGDRQTSDLLWARNYPFDELTFSEAFQEHKKATLIAGHTAGINLYLKYKGDITCPKGFIFHSHKGHYINTDCGLAYRYSPIKKFIPRLGFIRLEDGKEYYI